MSTLSELEQRKHDLRVEMVRLRAERNTVQMIKVYQKLCEVKRAEAYFMKSSKGHA